MLFDLASAKKIVSRASSLKSDTASLPNGGVGGKSFQYQSHTHAAAAAESCQAQQSPLPTRDGTRERD
jgi:hypothetical protein